MLTTEQKLLCALAHLGTFIGIPIIAPIIVLLVSKDSYTKMQAKEALGFQILLAVSFAVAAILVFLLVGIPLILVLGLVGLILPIVAIVKVLDGVDYSYPLTGQIVRKNF
ncbi:MAG: DUF4870 domain-containing protein [Firmicutes bacterium]|nr:DUF4870 domain-containing protein [Bacillota bacterium]